MTLVERAHNTAARHSRSFRFDLYGESVPTRSSLRPENALTPRLVRREAIQLGVIAVLTLVALVVAPHGLRIAAGLVDVIAALLATVALTVAWRAGGRGQALGLYAVALAVFVLLAALNLR